MTRARLVAAVLGLTVACAGCGHPGAELPVQAQGGVLAGPEVAPVGSGFSVTGPGPLRQPAVSADVLVVGDRSLPGRLRARLASLPQVRAVTQLALASVPVAGRTVTVAAVDPASYRRFTPEQSAESDPVWERVASGDLALSRDLAAVARQPLGAPMTLGNQPGALTLRVGAFAAMTPMVDAVVNTRRGAQLGMRVGNAVLLSARPGRTEDLAERLEQVLPAGVAIHPLTDPSTSGGERTALLTGGSVGHAVGGFRYRYFEDGTVAPDPAWVRANIVTGTVPILGRVTCHRVMLPQLHAALQEVVDSGLADAIDASDYGGCYVPRFIAHDPAKGLSLHTWGIAVDLNVAGNLRGTRGEIDRDVVAIFKKWGFAWGGDWAYTDPMHFELAALVRPR